MDEDDKLKPRIVLTSAGYIADEDDDIQVYQRPWVELAPEDRLCAKYMLDAPEGIEAVIDYITSKLKDKNT
jgi:hypothetical protein